MKSMTKNKITSDRLVIRWTLTFFICSILFSTNLFSQKSIRADLFSPIHYLINKNPIVYELSYEQRLKPHFSILVGCSYGTFIRDWPGVELKGISPFIESRYYFKKDDIILPKGFFVGGYCKAIIATYDRFDSTFSYTMKDNGFIYGVGLDAGYKIKLKSFSIEPLIGLSIGKSTILKKDFGIHKSYRLTGNLFRFELSIGYEF